MKFVKFRSTKNQKVLEVEIFHLFGAPVECFVMITSLTVNESYSIISHLSRWSLSLPLLI